MPTRTERAISTAMLQRWAGTRATLEIGARPGMAGKRLVVIVASAAERYLSTELFSEL